MTTPPVLPRIKPKGPKKPRSPAQIAAQKHLIPAVKGQVLNPNGRRTERSVDGVPLSKIFSENLGPAAVKVIEKVLHNALMKPADQIRREEIELAKFMQDRVYGKAEENINLNANVNTTSYDTSTLSLEQLEMISNSVEIIDVEVK